MLHRGRSQQSAGFLFNLPPQQVYPLKTIYFWGCANQWHQQVDAGQKLNPADSQHPWAHDCPTPDTLTTKHVVEGTQDTCNLCVFCRAHDPPSCEDAGFSKSSTCVLWREWTCESVHCTNYVSMQLNWNQKYVCREHNCNCIKPHFCYQKKKTRRSGMWEVCGWWGLPPWGTEIWGEDGETEEGGRNQPAGLGLKGEEGKMYGRTGRIFEVLSYPWTSAAQ